MRQGSDSVQSHSFDPRFQRVIGNIRAQFVRKLADQEPTVIMLVVPKKTEVEQIRILQGEVKAFLTEVNRACRLDGEPRLVHTVGGINDALLEDSEPDTIAVLQAHLIPQVVLANFALGRYHLPRLFVFVSEQTATELSNGRWTVQFKDWFQANAHEHYWPLETTARRLAALQAAAAI